MNRVDVPRETAARRPLIRSQTRFSPPLPPSSPIMKPDIITLDPITSIPAILLSSQFRSSPCSAIQQRRIQLSREFYFFQKFYLHEIFVRPINRRAGIHSYTRVDDERHASHPFERERESYDSLFSLEFSSLEGGDFDGVHGNVFPSMRPGLLDSRNVASINYCRRTINVPGYNAIICYRLSSSPIELRPYHYRTGAFLTLDYFCQGQNVPS